MDNIDKKQVDMYKKEWMKWLSKKFKTLEANLKEACAKAYASGDSIEDLEYMLGYMPFSSIDYKVDKIAAELVNIQLELQVLQNKINAQLESGELEFDEKFIFDNTFED